MKWFLRQFDNANLFWIKINNKIKKIFFVFKSRDIKTLFFVLLPRGETFRIEGTPALIEQRYSMATLTAWNCVSLKSKWFISHFSTFEESAAKIKSLKNKQIFAFYYNNRINSFWTVKNRQMRPIIVFLVFTASGFAQNCTLALRLPPLTTWLWSAEYFCLFSTDCKA